MAGLLAAAAEAVRLAGQAMTPASGLRHHPLLGYFAVAYGISWGGILVVLAFTGFDLAKWRPLDTGLIFIAMLLGPSIAGLTITALLDGRRGLRELVSTLACWRVSGRWYGVAMLTMPLLLLATLWPLSVLVDPAFAPRFQWPLFAIGLEERLGIRLLTRTTRSVSPTEAGERLLRTVGPRFEEVETELAALNALRQKPAGTIRITAGDHPAVTLIWPKLSKALAKYPDVKVEINMEGGLIDIAAQRFDAGVRLGEQVAKDMVSVRIGPDVRFAVVGNEDLFRQASRSKVTAGPYCTFVYQPAPAYTLGIVGMGIRTERS